MSGSTNHWKVILYKNSVHLAKYIHGVMLINPNPKTQALSLSPGLHCKPMMTLWNQIGHTTNQSKASMWGGVWSNQKNAFLKSFLNGISPEQNSIGISGSTTIEKSFYTKTQHFCIEWSWKEHVGHLFLCILQNPRNVSSIELEENRCAIVCLFLKTIM